MKRPFSFLAVLLLAQFSSLVTAEPSKPNIIYILADDLGYGDVHCLNPERGKIPTPHLDKLASQGMTFTDAHSGSSVCTPTRYGVLTGRYAWRTRLQSGVLSNYDEPLISADRLTVPGLLKQHGYHTAIIGKWHLGYTLEGDGKNNGGKGKSKGEGASMGAITRDGPVTRGFDEFFGFHHARMMKSVFENDRVTQIIEPVDMLATLAKRSADYIAARTKTDQPFFLYLPLNSPHTPIVPSKPWQGKSGLGDYGDFVMETDWAVGEVLSALDQAGIADNTLVFFTSDNGCSPAAKVNQLEAQGHHPSAEHRGYKADIWDGGHRVAFFARWPAKIKAGSTNKELICHTDLMTTCAEILGAKLPDNAGEDSLSILPALLGQTKVPIHEAVVHHSISGRFAIRQAQWKLELCPGSGGWGKPGDAEAKKQGLPDVQLYDLSTDIGESKNLQAAHPEIVERLTQLLEQTITNGRSTPGVKQTNDAAILVNKPNTRAPKE
ncbi:MAG: arylsulfatase [Verrucomicrobia bacterium]|nr:arylsulfatase [Verrucomicrobiota bacterium]